MHIYMIYECMHACVHRRTLMDEHSSTDAYTHVKINSCMHVHACIPFHVCRYICTHLVMRAYTHVQMYPCGVLQAWLHDYECMYKCMHAQMCSCKCMRVCKHISMSTCVHVCMDAWMHECMFAWSVNCSDTSWRPKYAPYTLKGILSTTLEHLKPEYQNTLLWLIVFIKINWCLEKQTHHMKSEDATRIEWYNYDILDYLLASFRTKNSLHGLGP